MTGVSPSDLIQEINQWQEAYEKLQSEKMQLVEALKAAAQELALGAKHDALEIVRAALAKAEIE